jgi:hypothetical protein
MSRSREDLYTAPLLLATAFLLIGLAIVEKGLNLLGWNIPFIEVYPRQILDWAVVILILDIALSLRQILDHVLSGTPRLPSD